MADVAGLVYGGGKKKSLWDSVRITIIGNDHLLSYGAIALAQIAIYRYWKTDYFDHYDMKPWGLSLAAGLCAWTILAQFALHGAIMAFYEYIQHLKVQKDKPGYDFHNAHAAYMSTLSLIFSRGVFAFLPMRHVPGGASWSDILIGYIILCILADAWFFFYHYAAHVSPWLYKQTHKRHHAYKDPHTFSSFFVAPSSMILQEHIYIIPLHMLFPNWFPMEAFTFLQYVGIPFGFLHHCGFELENIRLFGPIKLGHLFLPVDCGLSLILGAQTTELHDFHHKNTLGNYALSYTYLDHLFGTYIDPNDTASASRGGAVGDLFGKKRKMAEKEEKKTALVKAHSVASASTDANDEEPTTDMSTLEESPGGTSDGLQSPEARARSTSSMEVGTKFSGVMGD